jgi:hypothetical protein
LTVRDYYANKLKGQLPYALKSGEINRNNINLWDDNIDNIPGFGRAYRRFMKKKSG